MRHTAIVFLLLTAATTPSFVRAQDALETRSVVQGTVVRPSGLPVVGARVELFETEERAVTDSTGRFVLRTTWTGPALLVARALGDPPVSLNVQLPSDSTFVYVARVAEGRRHLLGMTLSALLPRLDAARFVRIHRSHVVNLDFVSAIRPHDAGRYLEELRDEAKIAASRSGTQRLRQLTA
jgi:hypothetical protein